MKGLKRVARFVLGALVLAALSLGAWAIAASRATDLPPLKEAPRRAPEPAKARRLSDDEAEHLFRRILGRIRDPYVKRLNAPAGCGTRGSWLSEDAERHSPEARLFARAYPDLARRLVMEILEDPEAPAPDYEFALNVLTRMEWTSERLEEILRAQVEAAGDGGWPWPLGLLGRRDRDLRYLDLYRKECRRGNLAAFAILSRTFHPSSIPLFEELARESRERPWPLGGIPREAGTAIQRLRILNSSGWREGVERSLRVPGAKRYEDYDELMWAFEVARLRGLPTLRACLADRLRRIPEEERGGRGHRDLVLSLFAQEGGVLTAAEFQRLAGNGFVGDAEERLLEIAGDERRR